MAVNATEVLYLTSGLFKAVPSKAILTDLVKFNGTIDGLAASLGTSPYAVNAFPFSNAEKAKTLAENLLGSTVADKAAAITALEGILNANGGNVGIAAAAGIRAILSDAAFADAKAQLENRVKVAAHYVDSNKGNEISTSILDAVTKDAATVTAAIANLSGTTGGNEAGADRVLTTAQDILTGTAGNDNFRAVAGANTGNQDQSTLNSSDIIDGAAGNDTLIVNLVNGGAAANYGGGARIKNIETLKLGTNATASFDYNVNQGQNEITDVTTIVADQINTGETLTIRNLVRDAADKALPTLSWINDSTAVNGLAGTVNVAYRAAAVSGTADEQAINLTNVRAGTLNINAGIEKAVVASTGTSTNSIRTIDSITGTTTTLKEVVINAEATAALGEGRIISEVNGTRGLEVARAPANDNTQHVSFVNVGSAVTKVDASGSKGNVNVAFTDTATAVANTFIGGEGNDQVVVNGGNDNLSGGKGDDTFIFGQTNTSANGTFFNNSDTIDGGEGTDTILFDYGNGAVTIQTSEWLNSKGVDAIDLRGQNNRVQLDDAFVARADATSFEVITNKIVQNDAANSVADEVNSRHQIDLSTVGANRAVKVTGGEGRETVIVTDALNGMQTLSGGNGLDVLVVKNGATLTGQDLQNVSGFNVMNLVKTSGNAQVFNIDLSASFLTKAIDANAAAGTSVNTANLFRIVTDGADASGTANSLSGVQAIDGNDTINITIDTAGLTAGSGAINVNDLLATNAAVRIRNAAGQDLVTKAAGANQQITVTPTAGNIFTAANATATADTTYTQTGAASVGTLTTSGQASTGGGGGVAPAAGNTFTLTAGQDIITTTSTNLAAQPGVFFSNGSDTVIGGAGLVAGTDILVDGSTTDADVFNAQLVGGAALTPTNWTNIETINFDLLGDHIGGNAVTLTGAIGYKTLGVTGANRQIDLADVRNGTTVNIGNGVARVEIDKLGTTVTDTLTVNLTGGTVGTTTPGQQLDLDAAQSFSVVTINSTGAANTVYADFAANQFSTNAGDRLTITGNQNLTLVATSADLTGQRITSTNTGTTTINTRDAGAANVNAANFVGITNYLTTNTAAANTVNLTGLLTNSNVTVGSDSTVVTLAAQTAGSTVNVTANGDMTQLVGAAGHNITTANLTLTTGTDNGAAAENASALTINLSTAGGVTPTVNLLGTTAAERGLTVTLTSGNLDASNFTVNGTDAVAGVISTTGITVNGAAAGGHTITGTAKADSLTGAAGADILNGGAGNDTITGGAGADVVSGGTGTNTFVFAAGDNGAAPSATVFDTITDFRTGTNNVIDFGATAITIGDQGTAAAAGVATISGTGVATFNVADTTLAQHLTAVAAAIVTGGATVAGESVIWQEGANAYLFISDNVNGVSANDVLIQLTGVTVGVGGLTITGGDITAIA